MSVDTGNLSTQPLAQLLKSTDPLTQSSLSTNGRRNLRPDILDIQRTKDVGGTQPVSLLLPCPPPSKPTNAPSPF